MNDVPRRELRQLFQTYGETLYDEPVRFEGLLLDYCGSDHRPEAVALTAVLRSGAVGELRQASGQTLRDGAWVAMTRRVSQSSALSEEMTRWALSCWAEVTGVKVPSESAGIAVAAKAASTQAQRPAVAAQKQLDPVMGDLALLDFPTLKARYRMALAEAKTGNVSHAEIMRLRTELSSRSSVFEKEESRRGRWTLYVPIAIIIIYIIIQVFVAVSHP